MEDFEQGDQIGQFFAHWQLATWDSFWKNAEVTINIFGCFFLM
jgi:hypothetical protein